MLQKFKVTTCAFILCLFGLTLMTVSPVLADVSTTLNECKAMKWSDGKKAKKDCFRDGWSALLDSQTNPQAPEFAPEYLTHHAPNTGKIWADATLMCEDMTEVDALVDAVELELVTKDLEDSRCKTEQSVYDNECYRILRAQIKAAQYNAMRRIRSALCPMM